ncbi:hypothetical protein PR003_g11096 [Phytophthora rubi]|uniref:Uncharacterized protein n=1 Tax=Phytophthora rubi TaxID=129364 RepID=A0A6A3MSZ3_9STRA|nr:hypothetical protein PR001_g10635 [Phytophthora rubi]KAE9039794.1 hypothetical protein PR002_g5310 [Phytophthora rubi]KAE9339273.1 hypothetical protein PR003_g11096 [Phytophthora rubi]
MNDIELQSMTDFQEVTSADAAAVLLEKILESSLATFQSHEDTDESDSNDEEVLAAIVPPTKLYLQRQLVYSRKYVKKKEHNKIAMANSFVAGLKLVNILLEARIERTKTVTMTRRLISLDKNDKWYEADLHTIEREAEQQLALNHTTMNFVDAWVATWCHSKTENGKFFLKPWASKIDDCIGALARVGTKLEQETTELKFCVLQKPSGVWI